MIFLYERSPGITRVIAIHLEGKMKVSTKFHCKPSNRWDRSIWTRAGRLVNSQLCLTQDIPKYSQKAWLLYVSVPCLSVSGMITAQLRSCWSEGAAKMLCGYSVLKWATTVLLVSLLAHLTAFPSLHAIVTVQIQTCRTDEVKGGSSFHSKSRSVN